MVMAVLLLGRDIPEKLKSPMMFNTFFKLREGVDWGSICNNKQCTFWYLRASYGAKKEDTIRWSLKTCYYFFYDNVIFSCLLKNFFTDFSVIPFIIFALIEQIDIVLITSFRLSIMTTTFESL